MWGNAGLLAGAVLLAVVGAGCASAKPMRIREVSPGILEGRKPSSPADFEALQARGVRTILSLEQHLWNTWPERRRARRHGFVFRNVVIPASPFQPREESVKAAVLTLHDSSLRPIYVHCYLGSDRNAFIVALYLRYFEDWTPQAAWDEMIRLGFHESWRLRGFGRYYWHHTEKPEWVP